MRVPAATALALSAALLALVLPVQADDDAKKTVKALKECARDSGLTSQALQKACDHEVPAGSLDAYKCFTRCVQIQVGIMSPDGTINPEASAALVPAPERAAMLDIATQCTGVASKDLCEKGYTVDKCYQEKNKEMYKRNCMALMKTLES